MLKINYARLRSAPLGDSHRLRPGDPVVAIGNPLGFEHTVSTGVVSASRTGPFRVDGHVLGDMIQTDAPINQGNSGGGLFNASGKLVGITTAIMAPRNGSGNIGIGFAIPAHRLRPVVEALIAKGRVPRPWLGLRYRSPQANELRREVPSSPGVLIEDVIAGSPAERAGILPEDILRQLGNCPMRSADDIYRFVDRYHPGDRVTARLRRGDAEIIRSVSLTEKPG